MRFGLQRHVPGRIRVRCVLSSVLLLAVSALALAACGGATGARSQVARQARRARSTQGSVRRARHGGRSTRTSARTRTSSRTSTRGTGSTAARSAIQPLKPLPAPAALAPFGAAKFAGEGAWHPAGRAVGGMPAVYETALVPPGGTQPAGIAWMDTRLLYARLYSGSESPGGGPYRFTAAIQPAQAKTLVAAFNGGFMGGLGGGYYTQHELIHPLVAGDASLVIYADGSVNVGAWREGGLALTPNVVSVRQNLVPLVSGGQPTAKAASLDWQAWGATCGAVNCAGPGIEDQWRSGVGVTADGALVYVTGPGLSPLVLAQLLVRAGVLRGMQLDINPDWTVFVTYRPARAGGLASPVNGSKLLAATVQGPATFFDPSWARDFITMSARSLQGR